MDLSGALINGLLAIIGYVAIFLGVYKLFQIAGDIREIKNLIANARRTTLSSPPLAPGIVPEAASVSTNELLADASADSYAENLLRAVNAESQSAEAEPHEVR